MDRHQALEVIANPPRSGLAFNLLDPKSYLTAFGLVGVWVIMFTETGILLRLFLPGDSLLFLAGVAASGVGTRVVGTPMNLAGLVLGAPLRDRRRPNSGTTWAADTGPDCSTTPTPGCSRPTTWTKASTTSTDSARPRPSSWPGSSPRAHCPHST